MSRFIHAFGTDLFCNANLWPTRDGIIPHKMYLLFCRGLESVTAAKTFTLSHGHALGEAMAYAGKDAKVRNQEKKLMRMAFPKAVADAQ